MDNSLFIKKVCGLVAMGVLGVAIVVTTFVFGREDNKLETDSGKTTTAVTTTTTSVTTTVASESENSTTTTAPSVSDESATATTPTVTEDTAETTTATTTQKSPETTTTTTKKPETTTAATTTKPAQSNGVVEITANISNSWDEGGKKCSQVDVVIKNNTDSAKDGWTAVLNFSKSIEVSNGWNGSFSANGSSLTITPAEYNSKIEAGSEVTFGVIVSGSGDVKISSATI